MAQVLILGADARSCWFLPSLLRAGGWDCDILSLTDVFRLSGSVRQTYTVPHAATLIDEAVSLAIATSYDWVLPTTDDLLGALVSRSLVDPRAIPLLPLQDPGRRDHLFSKIGLSRWLSRGGIATPDWRVVRHDAEALTLAQDLGWPLMVKQDRSYAGEGCAQCHTEAELSAAIGQLRPGPWLLQAWVEGPIYCVQALFWRSQLRCYSIGLMQQSLGRFGPSATRRYGDPLPFSQQHLESELQALGITLSAHGFANITVLVNKDHQPLFIEADLRPTLWLSLDLQRGGDFARALQTKPPTPPLQAYHQPGRVEELAICQQLPRGLQERNFLGCQDMLPPESPAFLAALRQCRFTGLAL